MNRVDLTALRLAVYEMKMDEDVPVGVAINEAVELAKLFGGEDSGSFVNGVLGKIASGKKDSGEEPKHPRRQTHSAKIIIRSFKESYREESRPEESAELNEKYFFSRTGQPLRQKYVYAGLYPAEDLCQGGSIQLQISHQRPHLFFAEG